jgi:predicted amidohydrolase
MTKTLRIAGAQIPIIDKDIQYNKKEIFKALDWAKENDVDLIQTPECSLSGYGENWEDHIDELFAALKEIEDYQKELGIALNLGTSMLNMEANGYLKRNQIRHYDKGGLIYGETNKTYVVPADGNVVPCLNPLQIFKLDELVCVGMICNDMWGAPSEQGKDNRPIQCLNEILTGKNIDIIFHSTNGYKFAEFDFRNTENYNEEPYKVGEHDYVVRNTMDKWCEAWLQMTAFRSVSTILTVDCCVHWGWDGKDERVIDKCKTSSPSGVISPLGEWVAQAPRYGRQYFYYDLPFNTKEKYWELINSKVKDLDIKYHNELVKLLK